MRKTRWVSIGLGLAALVVGLPAEAQSFTGIGSNAGLGEVGDIGINVLVDVIFAPPLIADAIYVDQGHRPPLVWPIYGLIGGASQVVGATALFVLNRSASPGATDGELAAWTVTGALGLANLALGIWALTLPSPTDVSLAPARPSLGWSVAPIALRDAGGKHAPGVTVSFYNF